MEKLILKLSLFFSILLIVGCNTDVDTEAPVLTVLSFSPSTQLDTVCGNLEDVISLHGGDSLIVDLNITDNEELSQYKLDIHNNFDCHGHNGNVGINLPSPGASNQTEDWTLLRIESIGGQEQNLTLTIEAPTNVTAGLYHFQIQALDVSGNDVPLANFYNLNLKNSIDTIPPVIQLQQPSVSTISVNNGDVINFVGTLSDNYSLFEGGNGVLFLSYLDQNSGNTFLSDAVFQITSATSMYDFDFDFTVPNSLTSGDYTLYVSAFDGVRNIAKAQTVVMTVN